MEHLLLVIHVVIAAALIGAVLIQRSDTDGFGLSGGSGSNLLSGRAASNLLTRTTAILATLFIINSLVLSWMAARTGKDSIVDSIVAEESAPVVMNADTKTNATAAGINRDEVIDTDKVAKKAAQKKSPAAADDAGAPAVPTAE